MTLETATTYEVYIKAGNSWSKEPRLVLEELSLNCWPEVPICRLRAVLSSIGISQARFGMEDALAAFPVDTEVLVVKAAYDDEEDPEKPTGACMFWGRITGPSPSWSDAGESVTLVCRHIGACLGDMFVIGSHGRAYDNYSSDNQPNSSQETYFPGWPAVLNPDGRANMTVCPYIPDNQEIRLFAPVGHLTLAVRWTTKKFLQYLFYWAWETGGDEIDKLTLPDLAALGEGDLVEEPCDFQAEGLSYLEAAHRVLEREGWRGRCETGGTGTSPMASVKIWQSGKGAQRELTLGQVGNNVAAADNAQHGSLVFDSSGIVTQPQLVGGPLIIEGTFRLWPAWVAADIDTGAAPDDNPDFDDAATWKDTYYKRYIAGDGRATDFLFYRFAGRKWALNEMGDYLTEAYGSQPDWTPDAEIGQGLWMKRGRKFGECLSRDAQGRQLRALVEISFDAGQQNGDHWQPLEAEVLQDEAAIYINVKDLSTIKPRPDIGAEPTDYWDAICTGDLGPTGNIRVRITATLADDSALAPATPLAIPAWSLIQRATQFYFDRHKQYARRVCLTTGP